MKCPECFQYELEDHGARMHCVSCDVSFLKAELQLKNKPLGEVKNMTEQKAVPLNVVVSDKGKKSVRVGKAFVNLDKMPAVSLSIDLEAIRKAIKEGTVSENEYLGNEKYPDPVLDGKKVLRMACFKIEKKA